MSEPSVNEEVAVRRYFKLHPAGTREAAIRNYETILRTSREAKQRRKQPCSRGCGNLVAWDSTSGVCIGCHTADHEAPHGTASRYSGRGCRCDECRSAHAIAFREATRKRHARMVAGEATPVHGRNTTYSNWMCRCDACRDAHRIHCGTTPRERP